MTTNPKLVELGYRIDEIVASGNGLGSGTEPGWYYGRPDSEGVLSDKVGPFETHAEALKHLEEELFADDEG
jgi:hypothetical protein